jgi:hypothetical protein
VRFRFLAYDGFMYRRALRKKNRSESIRQGFGVVAVGALYGTRLFAIADYFTTQHYVRPTTKEAPIIPAV